MKKFLGLFATVSLGFSASKMVVSCGDKDVVGDLTLIEGKTAADIISESGVSISGGTLSRAYEATEAISGEIGGVTVSVSAVDGETVASIATNNALRALFTETKDLAAIDTTVETNQGFAIKGESGASAFELFYINASLTTTSTSKTYTYKSLYKMTVTIPTS